MTIERLQAHYGFTLMPFGRSLVPQMLHRHATGSSARSARSRASTKRIYLGNPAVGARGLYAAALIPQTTELLAAETAVFADAPADPGGGLGVGERGRAVVLVLDEAHLLSVDVL
jgi:hypothetical protein